MNLKREVLVLRKKNNCGSVRTGHNNLMHEHCHIQAETHETMHRALDDAQYSAMGDVEARLGGVIEQPLFHIKCITNSFTKVAVVMGMMPGVGSLSPHWWSIGANEIQHHIPSEPLDEGIFTLGALKNQPFKKRSFKFVPATGVQTHLFEHLV